ncbi:hypothetical protein [Nitrosococcus wardiae]|uniref:Uncharacterized protein n=1 Tax=Nitrosococcus wardiae TaxID=1814290 RepID=A0A4P7BY80_9GAMM|nr:hypothetical protein [Nitrosococcus wardiae]QBQ53356.1 hypothetical protein E3U44_01665 [Nitrosococcus wardiae]
MAMTVLFIVLLHAVPVFIIGAWTKSKIALIFAAIIAGSIGAVTGNSTYIAADLIGVLIAYALGRSYINNQELTTPTRSEPPTLVLPRTIEKSWLRGIFVLIGIAIFLYSIVTDKPTPPSHIESPQQIQLVPPPNPPMLLQSTPTHAPDEKTKRPSFDIRHCLELPSNEAITKCANQYR